MRSRKRSTEVGSALAYPGWRVVGASMFGVMFGYAVLVPYTFSLFIKPMSSAFGWRRDQISLALTCVAVTLAACSALTGWLIDKVGPRRVIIACSLTFGATFASMAYLGHIAQLYCAYVVMGLAGNGTTQLSYSRAVCTWFERRRGMALSFVSAGAGAGAMIFPLATAWTIEKHGWRAAYGLLGTAVVVVSVPLAFLFVRDRDEHASSQQVSARGKRDRGVRFARPFLLLIVAIFLYSISFNAIISHLAPLLTDRGMNIREAAAALSVVGVCGLAGRLLTGYVLDRLFAVRVSMMLFLVTVAALLLVATGSRIEAFAGVGLLGFAAGGESDITPYLLSRYYSLRHFSFLYGCVWTAFAAGTAVGPYAMGLLFTRAGSYQARGIEFLALPTVCSAVLMFLMPRYSTEAPRNLHFLERPVLAGDSISSDS